VVSPQQQGEVEKIIDATGRKVGAVLVDMGLLRSDELLPAVRRHYESIILTLFSWSAAASSSFPVPLSPRIRIDD